MTKMAINTNSSLFASLTHHEWLTAANLPRSVYVLTRVTNYKGTIFTSGFASLPFTTTTYGVAPCVLLVANGKHFL